MKRCDLMSRVSGWVKPRAAGPPPGAVAASATKEAAQPAPYGDISIVPLSLSAASSSVSSRTVAGVDSALTSDRKTFVDYHYDSDDHEDDGGSIAESELTFGTFVRSGIDFSGRTVAPSTISDGLSAAGDDFLDDDSSTVFSIATKPWGRQQPPRAVLFDDSTAVLDDASFEQPDPDATDENRVAYLRLQAIQSCWAHNVDLLLSQLADADAHVARLLNETRPSPAALIYRFPLLAFAVASASPKCVRACLEAGADVRGAAAAFAPGLLQLVPLGAMTRIRSHEMPAVAAAFAECVQLIVSHDPDAATAPLADAASTASAVNPFAFSAATAHLPLSRTFYAMLRSGVDLSAGSADAQEGAGATVAQHFLAHAGSDDMVTISELLLAEARGTNGLDVLVGATTQHVPIADAQLLDFQWAPAALLISEAVSLLRVPLPDGSYASFPPSAIPAGAEVVWLFPSAPGAGCPDKPMSNAAADLASRAAARCRVTRDRRSERDGCSVMGNVLTARAWRAGWDGAAIEAMHLVHVAAEEAPSHMVPSSSSHAGAAASEASVAGGDKSKASAGSGDGGEAAPAQTARSPLGHVLAIFLRRPVARIAESKRRACALALPGAVTGAATPAAGGAGAGAVTVHSKPAPGPRAVAVEPAMRLIDGKVMNLADFWAMLMLPLYDEYHVVVHAPRCDCRDALLLRQGKDGARTDELLLSLREHPFHANIIAPPPAPFISVPTPRGVFPDGYAEEADTWRDLRNAWRQLSGQSSRPPRRPYVCRGMKPDRGVPAVFGTFAAMKPFMAALQGSSTRKAQQHAILPVYALAKMLQMSAARRDGDVDSRPVDKIVLADEDISALKLGADWLLRGKGVQKIILEHFVSKLLRYIATEDSWKAVLREHVRIGDAPAAGGAGAAGAAGRAKGLGTGGSTVAATSVTARSAGGLSAASSSEDSEIFVLVSLSQAHEGPGSIVAELAGSSSPLQQRGATLRALARTPEETAKAALQIAGVPVSEAVWWPQAEQRGQFVCCTIPPQEIPAASAPSPT